MFLSNRDIKWAIDCGKLIVYPRPEACKPPKGYDETSIDLHLAPVDDARVWDLTELGRSDKARGRRTENGPEVSIGTLVWDSISAEYQKPVPRESIDSQGNKRLVYRKDNEIIVRRFGFLLWTTKEEIGTPRVTPGLVESHRHPELICFVNAKSTKARTGLLVHFTAPTFHAGWSGKVTLEIANLGPFTLVLKEDDALAQLTVATISSAPDLSLKKEKSKTQGQTDPSGAPREKAT